MNVYEAAIDRIKVAFRDFDNVLLAVSFGKDSGVMLNLAYEYAKENNLLHKMSFYYQDYEAGYKYTHEYADRAFKQFRDVNKRFWICLPHSAACSVSMYEPRWIPWDEDKKDIWVRDMPKYDYVMNMDNKPESFKFSKGDKGFFVRIDFAKWFASEYGSTAVLIGIRADESLVRRAIFTSERRVKLHKEHNYTKHIADNVYNFYPIYDWNTADIWYSNYKFNWDYNKIYDLYYQSGLTVGQMRVASPFHRCGQGDLKLYRVIDPHNWGRMVGRVNGVNFGGIYGGTSAMGFRNIKKPEKYTWKEYAEFLISTLPEATKKKFIFHLDRLQNSWKDKGYGRNPDVIKQMESEGIKLEKTGEVSNLCTKPKYYEIIKILSGFPETTEIKNFRRCPSWRKVCVTIMKNDFSLTYMGCSRTKQQNKLKNDALKKYKKASI